MLSLIIPVYKNEENLTRLLSELKNLESRFRSDLEIVFVVDGSPDRSLAVLRERVPGMFHRSQVVSLTRNFGSFNAIVAGLEVGRGDYFAVLAADLQEPPELVIQMYEELQRGACDLVFGYRLRRADPWLTEFFSALFWGIFRRFVVRDMPKGGVDVFGCTLRVRDRVLKFSEFSTNLVALLFWVGFTRSYVGYARQPRREGMSAWTMARKLRYCVDSIFNFTDLPIRMLLTLGASGIVIAVVLGTWILIERLSNGIGVPGYTALAFLILFFGSLTTLGLGIVGQYVWLNLQNARRRPNYLIDSVIMDNPLKTG